MALSEEHAIGHSEGKIWLETRPAEFTSFRRFRVKNVNNDLVQCSYPWLRGQSVVFVGVPASVVGTTEINLVSGSDVKSADVAFVSTIEAFALNPLARSVYVPFQPGFVELQMPGWFSTGRVVGDFFEYCRNKTVCRISSVLSFGQRVGVDLYPPVSIFPCLDSSILGHPLKKRCSDIPVGVSVYSIRILGKGCVIEKFQPHLWRTSIWEKQGDWGLLIGTQYLSQCMPEFCLDAAVKVPWDATVEELRLFEVNHPFQDQLRCTFHDFLPLQLSEISTVVHGQTFRYWVNTQLEFTVGRVGFEMTLRVTSRSHPSGALYARMSRDLELARQLPFERGFEMIRQKLVDDHSNYYLPG